MTNDKRRLPSAAFWVVTLALGAALPARTARAETIELLDKTKLNAKIIHYYDGVYTVESGGQTIKLPKEKIRAISWATARRRRSACTKSTAERKRA